MDIEVVICHYGSGEILNVCVNSLKRFYKDFNPFVIDSNITKTTHGEALDIAFRQSTHEYILTVDNDIRLYQTGTVEKMSELMEPDVYAVGEFVGHEIGFIHPKFALWQRKYVVDNNLSFKDCVVYCRECDRVYEYQTGQLLGYQLQLSHGYRGVHFPVLDCAHHLSEKK